MLKRKFCHWLIWPSICSVVLLTAGQSIFAASAQSSNSLSEQNNSDDKLAEQEESSQDKSLEETEKNISPPTDKNLGVNTTDPLPPADWEGNLADAAKSPERVKLFIRIAVPHNTNAKDWCRVYPYPVAPPTIKKEIEKLPTKEKDIREGLLAIAYLKRTNSSKPYPGGGWRMQYALAAASRKSGIRVPHTIFTEYPWVDNILPYMEKEIRVLNAKELARTNRYQQAATVFKDYKADLEVQSFNKGLFPIDVPIIRQPGGYRTGRLTLDKYNWWIVAMHKVPGLKYYWLWPVKLNDNPEQLVVLNEDNAIYIEGAW